MEIYEKAVGTVLLVAGLAIIGYGLNSVINVFVKAQSPPEIFKSIETAKPPETNSVAATSAKELPKNISEINPAELQKMISGNGSNGISPDMIRLLIPQEIFDYAPRLANYTVFSIFIWILFMAGGKVSALGISLIKTNSVIKL